MCEEGVNADTPESEAARRKRRPRNMFDYVLSWKAREMREAADQRPIERKMMVAGADAERRFCRKHDIDFAWKNHWSRPLEKSQICACGVKIFA